MKNFEIIILVTLILCLKLNNQLGLKQESPATHKRELKQLIKRIENLKNRKTKKLQQIGEARKLVFKFAQTGNLEILSKYFSLKKKKSKERMLLEFPNMKELLNMFMIAGIPGLVIPRVINELRLKFNKRELFQEFVQKIKLRNKEVENTNDLQDKINEKFNNFVAQVSLLQENTDSQVNLLNDQLMQHGNNGQALF